MPDEERQEAFAGYAPYRATALQQHCGSPPALERAVTVETASGQLYIDEDDTIMLPYLQTNGIWSPEQTRLVRKSVRSGMRFVDVGAHVGYFTLLAAQLVGPTGVVFAFEPHPSNFDLLLANIWRHGLTNVLCFPWAASDTCGFAELFEAPANTGDHRLYPSPDEERRSVRVRTVALDKLGLVPAPVHFVKIDVQGAEQAVLRGMERLLDASPEAPVALEYWPLGMQRFGGKADQALAYYRRLGYVVWTHHPDYEVPVVIGDDEIIQLCNDTYGHVDLVLLRASD